MAADQIPGWVFSVTFNLARAVPWKRVMPRLVAQLFGTLVLRVEDSPSKQFYAPGGTVTYTMAQAWICNDSGIDAESVKCSLFWRRHGTTMVVQKTAGLWFVKAGTGLASSNEPPTETVDLLSNGDEQHLGLVVKKPGAREAYIVAPGSYYDPNYPDYQHPSFKLFPGTYDVDAVLTALRGKVGLVKLEVRVSGEGGDVLVISR